MKSITISRQPTSSLGTSHELVGHVAHPVPGHPHRSRAIPVCGLLSTCDSRRVASTCRSSRSSKRRRRCQTPSKVATHSRCAPTPRAVRPNYQVVKDPIDRAAPQANRLGSEAKHRVQECCTMRRSESVDQRRGSCWRPGPSYPRA